MGAGAQEENGHGKGGGSSELLGQTGFWGGVYWVALKTAWATDGHFSPFCPPHTDTFP